MKVKVASNFVIPGLEGKSEVDLSYSSVTLRKVLEELSLISSGRVRFIQPMTDAVDPMDFNLEINGFPSPGSKEDLDVTLKEGDTITIKLSPMGGG